MGYRGMSGEVVTTTTQARLPQNSQLIINLKAMKQPKIFYMGKLQDVRDDKGRYSSTWKKVKWFFKMIVMGWTTGIILLVVYGAGLAQTTMTIIPVAQAETNLPPILEKIIQCESKGQQFGKSGQVLLNANSNGTSDVGIAQINTVWFTKATELGYDLTVEKDNIAMAEWIFNNKGTGAWSSSSNCWNK